MNFTLSLSSADLLLLLPEIFLTLWICMLLAVDAIPSHVDKKVIGNLSIVGLCATLVTLIWFYINGKTGTLFNGMYVLDPMAIYFKIFIVTSTILVVSMSIESVERFPAFRGEYYFLVLMSALGAMLMASANDLVSIFVTLEFTTFGFYILVAYLREDSKSNEAGLKFFILGAFTAGILAFGISLIYGATGKLILTDIAQAVGEPSAALIAGFLLLFAALGFKIGAVPLHTWIPDVYHGAPTPVTAFLSVAPKGAALAILLRNSGWVCRRVGMVVSSGGNHFNDLWKHRCDRAEQHETSACVFWNCPDRQRSYWARGCEQNGRGIHHVLSVGISLRKPWCICRRHRGSPHHQQRRDRRLQWS